MPRKKKTNTEIVLRLASEAVLVPKPSAGDLHAVLDRMVRERVDEILAMRDAGQLESDFHPREVSYEILSRQSVFEKRKWSLFYEKWGCRSCGKKTVAHQSSGHCATCVGRLAGRLAVIKRHFDLASPEPEISRQIDRLTSRVRTAQALLGNSEK